jgi:hypothetical protein
VLIVGLSDKERKLSLPVDQTPVVDDSPDCAGCGRKKIVVEIEYVKDWRGE